MFQVVFNSLGADLPTMRSLQTPDQRSPRREDGGLRKEEVEADEGKKMKKRKGRRRGGQERVTEEDERQVKMKEERDRKDRMGTEERKNGGRVKRVLPLITS